MKFKNGVGNTYKDILQFFYNGEYINRPYSFLQSRSPKSIVSRIFRIVRFYISICLYPLRSSGNKDVDLKGRIWLYANTDNQKQSLLPIYNFDNQHVFVKSNFSEVAFTNEENYRLKYNFKFIYFFRYFRVLLYLLKFDRRTTGRFFDLIFVSIGEYENAYYYLKKYKPKCMVFSNDHNIDCRSLLNAANDLDIPTVYLQHASVAAHFPPLSFGLNLLEGEIAHQKYKEAGEIQGEVKYIGISKFSNAGIERRKKIDQVSNIGIGTNLFDAISDIKDVIISLKKELPQVQISYRPHPSDTREINDFLLEKGVLLSTNKKESALDFLAKQDILIASNSNIHLEAACLGLRTISYEFTPDEKNFDAYGFSDVGLFEIANNKEELIQILNASLDGYQIDISIAKKFNDVLGTPYEGRNVELIIEYINQYLKQ